MNEDTPGLDLAAFRAWYDGQRPGEIAGELSGRVIAGGRSNLTYEVTDGTSWWIVRRPPLGHVQALVVVLVRSLLRLPGGGLFLRRAPRGFSYRLFPGFLFHALNLSRRTR